MRTERFFLNKRIGIASRTRRQRVVVLIDDGFADMEEQS